MSVSSVLRRLPRRVLKLLTQTGQRLCHPQRAPVHPLPRSTVLCTGRFYSWPWSRSTKRTSIWPPSTESTAVPLMTCRTSTRPSFKSQTTLPTDRSPSAGRFSGSSGYDDSGSALMSQESLGRCKCHLHLPVSMYTGRRYSWPWYHSTKKTSIWPPSTGSTGMRSTSCLTSTRPSFKCQTTLRTGRTPSAGYDTSGITNYYCFGHPNGAESCPTQLKKMVKKRYNRSS